MEKKWVSLLVALIIGLFFGYLIGKRGTDGGGGTPLVGEGTSQIVVSANGDPGCAELNISKSGDVVWVTKQGLQPWVVFQDKSAFPDLKVTGNRVLSGPPNPSITPPPGGVTRSYFVMAVPTANPAPTGTPAVMNGRIIIHK